MNWLSELTRRLRMERHLGKSKAPLSQGNCILKLGRVRGLNFEL